MGKVAVSAAVRHTLVPRSAAMPQLFGRSARTRLLVALAINGPMHVRDIGRTIGSDSHKAWDMAEHLVEVGYLCKRHMPGGRKYVALDRSSPLFLPLHALLLRIAERYGVAAKEQPRYRWRMPKPHDRWEPGDLDRALGSDIRTSALLGISVAEGIDEQALSDLAGVKYTSLWNILAFWEREGVVVSRYEKTFRRLSLFEGFFAVAELRAFLAVLAQQSERYRALRDNSMAREQQRASKIEDTWERNRKKNADRARRAYWGRKKS